MSAALASERRERVSALLGEWLPTGRFLVGGEWIEPWSGGLSDVVEPATGATIGRIGEAGEVDVEAAVGAAERVRSERSWAGASPFERARVLRQIAALLVRDTERLALLESADAGKPYVDAEADVEYAAACFDYFASLAVGLDGSTRHLDEGFALIRREPVGTVGVITPFNFPIASAAVKLAPALAAGCSVVHKPSEQASLSALGLGKLTLETDLPPGVLNVVTGAGPATGRALVANPRVAKIVFTGSTRVGSEVAALAAATVKRVTMELGGKSANIVLDDAEVAAAAERSHRAYTFNAGQYCEAGSRLLVAARLHDDVVAALIEAAKRTNVGDPLDPRSEMGPLISAAAARRVRTAVAEGADGGVEILGDPGEEGSYVRPTVVVGAAPESPLARRELFGPVVTVLRFSDVDHAIEIANGSEFGLAAGVQTGELERGLRIAERLEAGTVWINDWATGNLTIPVGGWKRSGVGREQGPEGLGEFLELKSVLVSL
ncbi:aldehyde dehydrogenase [Thermoleophilia bacterium SCSIO 60948]|nr:aldehyde dehydrogenase [Thermoleophilia bacterium SCSIO 60948]